MAIIGKWYRTLRFLLNIFRLNKIDLNSRRAPNNLPSIPYCKEITYFWPMFSGNVVYRVLKFMHVAI
jgi:hypothetical protein